MAHLTSPSLGPASTAHTPNLKSALLAAVALGAAFLVGACGGPPLARVGASVTGGQAPLSVTFTNTSESADEFRWDFGDGSTATSRTSEEAVAHQYTAAGSHTVTLTAVKRGEPEQTSQASLVIAVDPGPLHRIQLEPTAVTLPVTEEEQFAVTAFDQFDNAVPDASILFEAIEEAGKVEADGILTASTKAGSYPDALTVAVTQGAVTLKATADVTVEPGALDQVSIEPTSITIQVTEEQQFTAAGFDRFENTVPDLTFSFLSDRTAGQVDSEGTFSAGTEAGAYDDSVTVEVTQGSITKTATADVTLEPAPLDHIVLEPTAATLQVAGEQPFTVEAFDQFDNPIPGLAITFSSAKEAGQINDQGVLSGGTKAGSHDDAVTVEVAQGPITKTAVANITLEPGPLDSASLRPDQATLQVADQRRFTAAAFDEFGNRVPEVSFAFGSDPKAGQVDQDGLFAAGTKPGTYTSAVMLAATQASVTSRDSARVTVEPGPLHRITVEPAEVTLAVTESQQFTVSAFDRFDNPLPDLTLEFNAETKAGRVDAEGTFTAGTKPGSYGGAVTVEVSQGDTTKTATATIILDPGPLSRVTIEPTAVTLPVTETQQFAAAAFDRHGNPLPGLTYAFRSVPDAGQIDVGGAFTAATKVGSYERAVVVEVTQDGITKRARGDVALQHGPLDSLVLSDESVTLNIGGSHQFSAEAFDAHANAVPEVEITWSAFGAVGDITSAGALTAGTEAGSYSRIVTATALSGEESVAAKASVTVKPDPLHDLSVPATIEVTAGAPNRLEGVVSDQYGNTPEGVQLIWTVLNADAGSITSPGILTAGEVSRSFLASLQVEATQGEVVLATTTSVNIVPGDLAQVVLAPSSIVLGIGMTQQLAAVAADQYGNRISDVTLKWGWGAESGTVSPEGQFKAGDIPESYEGTANLAVTYRGETKRFELPVAVTVAPDRIAFMSDREDEQFDVYVMDGDEANVERLTTAGALLPDWSPDGRRILYDNFRQIFAAGDDGSWTVELVPAPYDVFQASWSPDGTKLAFHCHPPEDRHEVCVSDVDGGNLAVLTDNTANDSDPAWSPDGKKIAFVSDRIGNREIYVMDADGRNQTRLTADTDADVFPAWSPDGKEILFQSGRSVGGFWAIYVMNSNGSDVRQLTPTSSSHNCPAWSPDGGKILFHSFRDSDQAEIYVMSRDGSDLTRLTSNAVRDWCPLWAPRKQGLEVDAESIVIPSASSLRPMTVQEVTERTRASVVRIETDLGSGSGFVIDPNGLILTNNHVIVDADEITVTMEDGTSFNGRVLGRDMVRDLALIEIDAEHLPALELGDLSRVALASDVLVLGFPLDSSDLVVTRGVVSAVKGDDTRNITWVQTDATINPGNSGGPLLNLQGQVIGVVSTKFVAVSVEGAGFAVSTNTIRLYLERLRAGKIIAN